MKKVLILGLAQTLEDAPAEYDGDIWTCNDGAMRRTRKHGSPKIDAMFEVHNMNVGLPSVKQSAILCETFNIPIYGTQEYPWLRNSHLYPIEEVRQIIGLDLFSDVICYMIAYAILKGYEQIDINGVHLNPNQRDHQESVLVHLWLGVAMGRGIKINVVDCDTDGCAILKNGVYWTGPGAYGHWDHEYNLALESEARDNPGVAPEGDMPLHEVERPEK